MSNNLIERFINKTAFLRLKKLKMGKTNEYYRRTLQVKPLIEADTLLLKRIDSVFRNLYVGGALAEGVQPIGRGGLHVVYGVGKICNPETRAELYLAVRLNHRIPYESGLFSSPLEEQLGAYEYAFNRGPNPPPYFVAAVTSSLDLKPAISDRVAGIITEDLSCGKKITLSSPTDENYVERWRPDCSEGELFFVDPNFGCPSEGGKKYLQRKARIDLK